MSVIYNTNVVTDSLVSYWDCANRKSYPGAGTTITDLVGGNNGTLTNGPVFDSSNKGNISFDGTNDYIISGNNSTLTGNPSFSISIWVKVPSDAEAWADYPHFLFWGPPSVNMYSVFFSYFENDQHRPFVGFWGGGTKAPEDSLPDGEWANMLWTRTGGGNASTGNLLYINGYSVALTASGLSADTSTPAIVAGTYRILGGRFSTDGSLGPYGQIEAQLASIAIWSRVLTAAEVVQNYNATKRRFE